MLGLVDSFNFHVLYLCSIYRTILQLASFSSSSLCQVWGETVCLWQFLISVCESDSCNHTYALSLSSPCRYYAICCQPLVYRNKMTPMRVALMIGGCWVIPTFISFLPIMQGWNSIGIDHLVSAAGWRPRGRGDLFHKFVEVKAARGDTKTSQRWKKAEQNMFSINRKKMGFWEVLFTRRRNASCVAVATTTTAYQTQRQTDEAADTTDTGSSCVWVQFKIRCDTSAMQRTETKWRAHRFSLDERVSLRPASMRLSGKTSSL